ncbi:hypothetical protein BU16DRAFT_558842 [Lophium mytilinum]|uniref:Uncharacterized protein n=1 Tax=Lophium mytilinum TaxID=390894 RepID=A0A6A6R5P9_9PEZI|nr:hypothetical protein BU16DRAFT_558842 [Lophium mytilinum]
MPWREEATREPFSMTNAGLSITLPTIQNQNESQNQAVAILSCQYADETSGPIGLMLRKVHGHKEGPQSFHVTKGYWRIDTRHIYGRYGRTVIVDPAEAETSLASKRANILLLRQQPTDFSVPVTGKALAIFKPDVPTAFSISRSFGAPDLNIPSWLRLPFSEKAFYPSLHWRQAPLTGIDTLLLPIQVDIGAIRISYRDTSFVVTFGLEKRNWHREALDAWIRIHSVEGDLTVKEIVQREQRVHHENGFATKKWGNAHSFTPKQFPDDRIQQSIVRSRRMGDFTFEIHGKATKLTISGVDFPSKSEEASKSQAAKDNYWGTYQPEIEFPGWEPEQIMEPGQIKDPSLNINLFQLEDLYYS